jgi:hypothetical protein
MGTPMFMKTMKNRGFALPVSIIMVLSLSIFLSIALMRQDMQLKENRARLSSQQAFNAAESGVERSVFELRRDPTWRPGLALVEPVVLEPVMVDPADPATAIGYYSLQVVEGAALGPLPTVWVRSTGFDIEQNVVRVVQARIIIQVPTAFFISTVNSLHIGSGTRIQSSVLARDVYFDVDPSFTQPDINVEGDVLYMRSIAGQASSYVHIAGGVTPTSAMTFLGVDLSRYRDLAQAQGHYEAASFVYTGSDISRDNLTAPNGVVFSEGDIHIAGPVVDSMIFVARGNIYIEGDLTASASSNAQLGLLAKKDVIIPRSAPSNITVDAFVLADGDAGSQGGILLAEGAKGSKQSITFNGAIAVRGDGVRTAADLNVYQTRSYLYNEQLRTNPQIPFLPAMANIYLWQEVDPGDPFPPAL